MDPRNRMASTSAPRTRRSQVRMDPVIRVNLLWENIFRGYITVVFAGRYHGQGHVSRRVCDLLHQREIKGSSESFKEAHRYFA